MSSAALERLREMLRQQGGLIATLVDRASVARADPDRETAPAAIVPSLGEAEDLDSPASLAAEGPLTEARSEEYELLVEAIYEGYLLHYGSPRVVRAPDADLRLLAGDRLYAIGLARLVELGDTSSVAELADTITLSALAQGAGEHQLADAIWLAGARAVGWGSSEAHRHAKRLVSAGAPEAIEAMRTSASAAGTSLET